MHDQNTLKMAVISLVAATWSIAAVLPSGARAQDSPSAIQTAGPQAPSAGSGENEPAFDASITVAELFDKAREAFGLANFGLAEQFYREILIRERSNVQAMAELSNVYERGGKLEYARGLLNRANKLDPDNGTIAARLKSVESMLAVVLAEETDSLLAGGQYELALPKLSVHLGMQPDNSSLYYKRAVCYSHLGRPKAALSSIDKALQFDHRDEYYQLRGTLLEDLRTKETRELVASAKKLGQSANPEDHDRALNILGQILQADPEHAWARSEFIRLESKQSAASGPEGQAAGEVGPEGSGANTPWSFLARNGRSGADLVKQHLGSLILLVAVLIVFRSPLTRFITNAFVARSSLSGRFPDFNLAEILVMLNSESHNGVLRVKGESCRGKIYLQSGEPCHCAVGKLTGVNALSHLFANTSIGHFELVEGSIPLNRTIDTPLSIILMEHDAGGVKMAPNVGQQQKSKSRMKELLESKTD